MFPWFYLLDKCSAYYLSNAKFALEMLQNLGF
jgi:hypothetical protein